MNTTFPSPTKLAGAVRAVQSPAVVEGNSSEVPSSSQTSTSKSFLDVVGVDGHAGERVAGRVGARVDSCAALPLVLALSSPVLEYVASAPSSAAAAPRSSSPRREAAVPGRACRRAAQPRRARQRIAVRCEGRKRLGGLGSGGRASFARSYRAPAGTMEGSLAGEAEFRR